MGGSTNTYLMESASGYISQEGLSVSITSGSTDNMLLTFCFSALSRKDVDGLPR